MAFTPGPGSGGGGSIAGSSDVSLDSVQNNQVLTYDTPSSKWQNKAGLDNKVDIVRWTGASWPSRPADAPFGVLFISTNDPSAPAPNDDQLQSGDVWRRHWEAV